MFKFNGETWEPYKKKVTYTKTVTEYDDVTDRFPADAIITDNALTDEQMIRLEAIKGISVIGLEDLKKYVLEGVIGFGAPAELAEADKGERTKKALLSSIDLTIVDPQVMVDAGLARKWESDHPMIKGEPVEHNGKLYKVLRGHRSQADWTPDQAVSLFASVLTSPAGPLPWVQPNSTNGYKLGDKVSHKGFIWESTHAGVNTWEPGVIGVGDRIWKKVSSI